MRAHAQAMNEYRGGEMSTEVVLDQNCGRKLWTVNESKNVLRAWLYGRTFDFRVQGLVAYNAIFLLCNTI